MILLVVAILTKIIGCGLGARISKCGWMDSLRIGVGMMARGEVALIMAQKGLEKGLLPEKLFSPIVLVVMITTPLAPIILNFIMNNDKGSLQTGCMRQMETEHIFCQEKNSAEILDTAEKGVFC